MVRRIFDTIRHLKQERGTTILLVEQNAFQALKIADRAYVMVNGRIAREATGLELLTDPEVQSAYLEGGLGSAPTQEDVRR
jgi:branched-chain amino acid transport system ATP-binding protein